MTRNANGKRPMQSKSTQSGTSTRQGDHLKTARAALDRWRLNIVLSKYSHTSFTAVAILPNQTLTSLASNAQLKTVEDIDVMVKPRWIWAQTQGEEVLAILKRLDDAERGDRARKAQEKSDLRKEETAKRNTEKERKKAEERAAKARQKEQQTRQRRQALTGSTIYNTPTMNLQTQVTSTPIRHSAPVHQSPYALPATTVTPHRPSEPMASSSRLSYMPSPSTSIPSIPHIQYYSPCRYGYLDPRLYAWSPYACSSADYNHNPSTPDTSNRTPHQS